MRDIIYRISALVALLLLYAPGARAADVFSSDVQMCSGRPWIDVTCPLGGPGTGADPTGAADSAAAINAAFAAAITNGWPVLFPAGTYKVASGLVWDYQGQAGGGIEVMSRGATIDGRTIASGPVLRVECSGGTTQSPILCRGLRITGELTVLGSADSYVVTLGKADLSDRHDAARVERLVAKNTGTGTAAGGVRVNYFTNGDLWLSGTTAGGSASTGAVAFEQVQSSRIGGYGSAAGASAPAQLWENGASNSNSIMGFAYDPNAAVCVSITSAGVTANSWLAPNLPCTTAVNASASASKNQLIGPTFAGTNRGPVSTGVSIVGGGSLHRYQAPAVSTQTLYGSDDGTIFSSANATGPASGFFGTTMALTLPDPVAVGSGWTVALVSDAGKAIVASPPGAARILARDRQLSSLIVGASNSKSYDVALLESDGAAGFRLLTVSQGAGLLNGLQTAFPATWVFAPGPGYATTLADNGEMISSAQTTSGLAVTLPQTTTLTPGWSVGFSQDGGKQIAVAVNGTNGGQIMRSGVATGQTSLATLLDHQVVTLFYDGSAFREISPPPSKRIDATSYGAACGAGVDATAALQLADNYFTAAGGGGTITVGCPLRVASTLYLDDYVHLQGEGPIFFRGQQIEEKGDNGGFRDSVWPPPSGPAIDCAGRVSQGINDCIVVRGVGVEVDHINFGNQQPTPPNSGFNWAPLDYGWIIGTDPTANYAGLKVHDSSFTAATKCIDHEGSPSYLSNGFAGNQATFSDLWMNGCFDTVMRRARIDQTTRIRGIDEDFLWGLQYPAVGWYAENHRIGLDLCYDSNTQVDGYEWYADKYAIFYTNCSVQYTSNFTKTFAAYNLKFTNVDFNQVCQAVGVHDKSVFIGWTTFVNVVSSQDNAWCGTQTNGAGHYGGNAFFDYYCDFCNAKFIGVHQQSVDTLVAAGVEGNVGLVDVNIDAYSAFTNAQPALKIPASAHVVGSCMNDFAGWIPASGAGPIQGPGADGTKGFLQPCYAGGAGSFGKSGGGSALLEGTGDTRSGDVGFYYDPTAPAPAGSGSGGSPANRLGFVGNCTAGVGCAFAADHGAMFVQPHIGDFPGTNHVLLKVDTPDGNTLNLQASGLVGGAPPSGTSIGTLCIDNTGQIYWKNGGC